jgi:transcriptional regulator with XRE-family HTH domain
MIDGPMSRSDNNDAAPAAGQKSDRATPGPGAAKDSIGMLIRMLRHQSGLTQDDLAAALGIRRSFVAAWETDRGGETQYLTRIAEVLGVSPEVFLNRMVSGDSVEAMTIDEAELLRLYRACDVTEKIMTRRFLKGLRKPNGA